MPTTHIKADELDELVRDLNSQDARSDGPTRQGRMADAILRLRRSSPDDIRKAGWSVEAHRDYVVGGTSRVFWQFTNRHGDSIKGDGLTDAEALDVVRWAISAQADDY